MPDRAARARALLAAAGWADARRAALAGDASPRRYERLHRRDGATAVLMDADPATGEDVRPFLRIARYLASLGLSPPAVLAADEAAGFLLLEDLGDDLYAHVLARAPREEAALYAAAADVLAHLHAAPPPPGLGRYDAAAMGEAAGLAATWYAAGGPGDGPGARCGDPAPIAAAIAAAVAQAVAALDARPGIALRDYHAENLIWLPARVGLARVGLLDFQLAECAPAAYDLVSLVQDARRDVAPGIAQATVARFAAATGRPTAAVAAEVAVLGAQRALRILGVFARLCLRDGKPGYLRFIPRVWAQLQANLAAGPGLAGVARAAAALPPPEPAVLDRIAARCARLPR